MKSYLILTEAEIFTDAKKIIMQLKDGNCLLLVIKNSDANEKQRILDYVSGAACALGLVIKQVSNEVFLIAYAGNIEGYCKADEYDDFAIS